MQENHLFSRKITQYSHEHTSPEPKLLEYLIEETKTSTHIPSMLCGRVEGRLLHFLVKLTQAKYCVEIGTFTGYSALSIAEGLPPEGKLLTCEIRVRHAKIAQKYFNRSPHGHKINLKLGPALQTLLAVSTPIDFCFIDADKLNYQHYYNLLIPKVKSGGLLVFDNAFYHDEVLNPSNKKAKIVHALNTQIKNDLRVEQVMLTIRDGILLVRKK